MLRTRGPVLSLLLAVALIVAAHGADKKERRQTTDNQLGEGFNMRPPSKDASQLEICILPGRGHDQLQPT